MSKKDTPLEWVPTLLFKQENWRIHSIEPWEAEKLSKQNTYFTEWVIYDQHWPTNIINYDLDKHSIIPEIQFLDKYVDWVKWWGLWPFLPLLLFWGLIFAWFFFLGSQDDSSPAPSNSPLALVSPVSNVPVVVWEPIEEELVETPAPVVVPVSTSQFSETESLKLRLNEMNFEMQQMNQHHSLVDWELRICQQDLEEWKNIAKQYLNESLDYKAQYERQKSLNISEDQLKLFLWETVLDLCDEQEDNSICKQKIYEFYKLRQN